MEIEAKLPGYHKMQFYLKPVNSAAVDEGREHSHSASEGISNGTHR